MGEGPKTDNDDLAIQLHSDIKEIDGSGVCLNRKRTWNIIDWSNAEIYSFTQLGLINFPEPLMCQEDLYLTYDQLPYVLNKDNVLINEDENHEYSFSYNDIDDIERVLDNSFIKNYELFMYDHTANRVCKLDVYLTNCEDDIVINIPETVEIVFNKEPFIEINPELLGIDVTYPCGEYEVSMDREIVFSGMIDQILPIDVKIDFDDGTRYTKKIQVVVSGIGPDPKKMYMEEKSFEAGETFELEVWSEGIAGLIAWQLQLEFNNAEVLSIQPSELFDDIPSNIIDDGKVLRALWIPADGLSVDADSEATWFTLEIRSDINGSTSDIFSYEPEDWSQLAIENESLGFEYNADFVFDVIPRDVLDVEENVEFTKIELYPNPASNDLNFHRLTNSIQSSDIEIFGMNGKLVFQERINNSSEYTTIDISQIPIGVYVLKVINGNSVSTMKFSKI